MDVDQIIVPLIRGLEKQYTGDSIVNDSWVDDIIAAFQQLITKWSSPLFSKSAQETSIKFVSSLNVNNRRKFASTMKPIGIKGFDVFGDSQQLQDILSASVAENTQLIKTIPGQYLNQVQTIVMSNMRSGLRPSTIVNQLSDQYGISKNRAKVIARDQTTKANGMISKQRQEDTGFQYFKWVDSDDSRVRARHKKISEADIGFGKGVYKWDNPPKNDKGQQIIPGYEIQCRCTASPVTQYQVDQNKRRSA